ncbi:MAG: cation:dicarboxylase symporter family transporter [Selenomonadaceae bacterium]|nr:cation:dicarboxylase symporter family transporter [Selenomonadaceae bacterium]
MNLTNENINTVVEDIRKFFNDAKVAQQDVLKICMVVEEALLRYQDHFGERQNFDVYMKKWFGSPKLTIRIVGEPFNPLKDTPKDSLPNEILQNLLHFNEAKTIYRYEDGYNELISFSTKERKPFKIPGGSITVSILSAIACSMLFDLLPQENQTALMSTVAEPILSTLLSLIVTITIFTVFFAIVAGICAIENVTMLSNIGFTVIKRFFVIDFVIIALMMCASSTFSTSALAFDLNASVSGDKFIELFLSIIPTNVVGAFMDKNILQVAVTAFMVGICITTIGNKISNVKVWFIEFNILVFEIMQKVFSVIPLVIFLCVFKALATTNFENFLSVWKLIVAEMIVFAAIILVMLIKISLKGVNLPDFLRKIFPAFVVAFTTGSSAASLPESFVVSKENLRIDEKFCDFWLPLALVLFSPSKLIQLTAAVFYVMSVTTNNEVVSPLELIVVALLAIQLSFSTPNAAGGIAASFSILLTQLGLPLEFIGSLMIADVLTGNLFTALNVIVREGELMDVSLKMGFADEKGG